MQLTITIDTITPAQAEAFLWFVMGYVGPDGYEPSATIGLDAQQELTKAEALALLQRLGLTEVGELGCG